MGSTIFTNIEAIDIDQQGPFSTVEYHIPNGPFSDYVSFTNPLEGSLILTKSLDYEKLQGFEVKIIAQDQGSPPQVNETTLMGDLASLDCARSTAHT